MFVSGSGAESAVTFDSGDFELKGGDEAIFRVAENATQDIVYLSPASQQVAAGENLKIEIWANVASSDVVAIAAEIKYDPNFLALILLKQKKASSFRFLAMNPRRAAQ